MPTADEAARLLVDTLLQELPEDAPGPRGQRAAVVLNGLGSVKYEELFVVYRKVAPSGRPVEDRSTEVSDSSHSTMARLPHPDLAGRGAGGTVAARAPPAFRKAL
ncbi:hypothetical protein [Streptomyces sp. DHE17-7]|uniref:hypothetical protein n=1 Tax=Streptomyces sp. DHE17-7 TaxID=2759949 RepID=UPI0022EA1854|nr:hypothetical protein [Streptomyces sp. DHE17-7]